MNKRPTNRKASRQAFTLVELIVVLMILVGLAAVLIPAVTDMVTRTNRSTSSSNIGEVAGAIQRYEAQYMAYPNDFDSLMTNLTTPVGLTTLPFTNTEIDNVALSVGTLAALNASGITSVGVHAVNDATFQLPTSTALTASHSLKGPTAATQVALGLETTGTLGKYVVLGVGSLCDLTGKTMLDAPVHFPRNAASNPQTRYSRFLAVFQITDGTNPLTRAKLVGVIAPDAAGLSTQLNSYFQIAANN